MSHGGAIRREIVGECAGVERMHKISMGSPCGSQESAVDSTPPPLSPSGVVLVKEQPD